MTYDEILSHFTVTRRSQDKAQCICPSHNDKEASLTVSKGDKGTVIHCHANCQPSDILSAVGLSMKDLFSDDKPLQTADRWKAYVEGREKRKIEDIYNYVDLNGVYTFTRLRLSGKKFIYGIMDGDRFNYGLKGKSRKSIPSVFCESLQSLKKAISNGETVFYCEGEKDVKTVNSHGLTGITCGASGDWVSECSKLFEGAAVVILQDNDKSGADSARKIEHDLRAVTKSVRIIVPTPDIEKGDISDFFKDHTVEDLEALLKEEPKKDPGQEQQTMPHLCCVADVEKKPIQFLIEPYIIKNNVTAIVGDGGVGKTYVWVDIASAVTNNSMPAVMGIPFDTKTPNTDGNSKVLYFTSEDNTAETLRERFEKAGADLKNLLFVPLEDECFHKITLDSTELEELIKQAKPALCVLDPLQSFVKGKMGDRNNMRRQLDCLTRLASVYKVSFLIIVHTNKLATSDPRTKLSDSSDIWDKCRSILFVGKTKEKSIRYLSQEKGNYTSEENEQATHLFTIKEGRIEECGTTDKTFYDFTTESTFAKDMTIRDDAKEFILSTLKDKEMTVAELEETATAYGIKSKTFERAKAELNKEKKIKYTRKSSGYGKGVQVFISLNSVS